jgi:cytochrome c-type biogenesis protein CcmH/NrfF
VIRIGAVAAATALLLVGALSSSAAGVEPRASLPDIEDEVMCTICGTLLAESESPQADRERALIRNLIAQGKDKAQIEDALVAQYGPRVLATPSGHGFDLLAWLVPGVAIAGALIAIVLILRRSRRRGRPDEPESRLDPADLSRLDRDMSSYDL